MKTTQAVRNIRMYKNKIDGKPKRVTTEVKGDSNDSNNS